MKIKILLLIVLVGAAIDNSAQTVTDYDGNVYDTVTIGTQVWLRENLKATHYRNGDYIPSITNATTWSSLSSGARCYYNNDSITNTSVYGALYNWFTVNDSHNLCPSGWHVSTDAEWTTLTNYLGGISVAGGPLKDTGTTHWTSPNTGATNSSGFTALPGGYRFNDGTFHAIGNGGHWWTSTACSGNPGNAWNVYLTYFDTDVYTDDVNYSLYVWGHSVRCIMDSLTTQINDNEIEQHIHLYPNPAIDNIIIVCPKESTIEITNIQGQTIMQRQIQQGKTNIDISGLAKGVYILRLQSKDKTEVTRIIKE